MKLKTWGKHRDHKNVLLSIAGRFAVLVVLIYFVIIPCFAMGYVKTGTFFIIFLILLIICTCITIQKTKSYLNKEADNVFGNLIIDSGILEDRIGYDYSKYLRIRAYEKNDNEVTIRYEYKNQRGFFEITNPFYTYPDKDEIKTFDMSREGAIKMFCKILDRDYVYNAFKKHT